MTSNPKMSFLKRVFGRTSNTKRNDQDQSEIQQISSTTEQETFSKKESAVKHIVVGAIDFGTSNSGYAYSFRDAPMDIFTNMWHASGRLSSEKTPTCILFDKNKTFRAFGFQAENDYAEYCFANKQKDWYFFRNYKMALYSQMNASKTIEVPDEEGRKFPLFTLITETLRFLKDHLIKSIQDKWVGFEGKDVFWVLTVPAIWTDSAKYFMREAAENAGIPGHLLKLCLEPEAASIYTKTIPYTVLSSDTISKVARLEPGDKYLLFDAGGGTVDIVVHEVGEDGALKELHLACGGDWGGTMVDKSFCDFLSEICGHDDFEKLRKSDIADFLDMMREFEIKKKKAGQQSDSTPVFIRVPVSVQTLLAKREHILFALGTLSGDEIYLKHGKILFSYTRLSGFFNVSLEKIKKYLDELLLKDTLKGVDKIVMVGGYSESPILQDFICKNFIQQHVIIPKECGLAVVKGAVLFGHDPSVIVERRCRFTYGIRSRMLFDKTIHEESTKFIDEEGCTRARGCFDIHVHAGQNIKTGVYQPGKSYTPHSDYLKVVKVPIYACPRPNPVYVTENDCFEIGQVEVEISDLTGTRRDKSCLVSLCFGGTEMTIKATKEQTGEILIAKINYDW